MECEIWQEQLWPDELYGRLKLNPEKCSIRLLHILAGKEDEAIRCKLFRTTLFDSPPYEALSYTWGASMERRTILINDVEILITVNLELAIRHLRRRQGRRTIWIDALCINQHDLAERSAQVQEMGNIYSSAERVLVWLGTSLHEHSDAADEIWEGARKGWRGCSSDASPPEKAEEHATITRGAVNELLGHPWWGRVWVVQEIARARRDPHIIVGSDKYISWANLATTARIYDGGCPLTNFTNLERLVSIRDRTRTPPRLREVDVGEPAVDTTRQQLSQDLSYLLDATHDFQSSDPRDKIFALWTLVRGTHGERLKADYHKSIAEVYTAVTCEIIEGLRNVEIIERRWSAPGKDLSSWVPDFSLKSLRPFPVPVEALDSITRLHGHTMKHSHYVTAEDVQQHPSLHVAGVKVGYVTKVLTVVEFAGMDARRRKAAREKVNRQDEVAQEAQELEKLQRRQAMVGDNVLTARLQDLSKMRHEDDQATHNEATALATLESDQEPFIPLIMSFASWLASTNSKRVPVRVEAAASKDTSDALDELDECDKYLRANTITQAWSAITRFCNSELYERMDRHDRALIDSFESGMKDRAMDRLIGEERNWKHSLNDSTEGRDLQMWAHTRLKRMKRWLQGEELDRKSIESIQDRIDEFEREKQRRKTHEKVPNRPTLVLFTTFSGALGFGSEHLQVNDKLVILQDMQSVCVLRPRSGEGSSGYTHYGSVFLHGTVPGAPLEDRLKEAAIETFKLV